MFVEVALCSELLPALSYRAEVWLLSSVDAQMCLEIPLLVETSLTVLIRALELLYPHVFF